MKWNKWKLVKINRKQTNKCHCKIQPLQAGKKRQKFVCQQNSVLKVKVLLWCKFFQPQQHHTIRPNQNWSHCCIYISLPNSYMTPMTGPKTIRAIFLLSDICFMRFDFINFDFGLDYTTKTTFGKCSDKFAVDIPTAVGTDPPAICGKNNGYHSELNWT